MGGGAYRLNGQLGGRGDGVCVCVIQTEWTVRREGRWGGGGGAYRLKGA